MNCPGSVGGKPRSTRSINWKCSRQSDSFEETRAKNCARAEPKAASDVIRFDCIPSPFLRDPSSFSRLRDRISDSNSENDREDAKEDESRKEFRTSGENRRQADVGLTQKKLPEGWLLSTSGSAPRQEAVYSKIRVVGTHRDCSRSVEISPDDDSDYNPAQNHCQSRVAAETRMIDDL